MNLFGPTDDDLRGLLPERGWHRMTHKTRSGSPAHSWLRPDGRPATDAEALAEAWRLWDVAQAGRSGGEAGAAP